MKVLAAEADARWVAKGSFLEKSKAARVLLLRQDDSRTADEVSRIEDWVATHNELLRYSGIMAWMQIDKPGSIDEALETEKAENEKEAVRIKKESPKFVDVMNGGILMLA